jgi:HDOD domain-containing protein
LTEFTHFFIEVVPLGTAWPSQVAVSQAVTLSVRHVPVKFSVELDGLELVRGLVERFVARELAIPSLPDVAVRIVRSGSKNSGDAHGLAHIIHTDAALTQYVLRIASSAAKRPAMPITSLQHAIAWLGLDDVANIAFTLALSALAPLIGKRAVGAAVERHAGPRYRAVLPVRIAAQHWQGGYLGRGT